jgi:hypothetical protein
MQSNADVRPRLFEADLTTKEYSISFNLQEKKTRLQITAFGDPFVQAVDCVSLLTTHASGPAGDHFRKLVKRCPVLKHNNKQLQDHIEVRRHCSIRLCT